jgi:hypothetical protein
MPSSKLYRRSAWQVANILYKKCDRLSIEKQTTELVSEGNNSHLLPQKETQETHCFPSQEEEKSRRG